MIDPKQVKMRWVQSNISYSVAGYVSKLGRLQVKEAPDQPWIDYTASQFFVKDHAIKNGSKGYATMQNILKQGGSYYVEQEQDDN